MVISLGSGFVFSQHSRPFLTDTTAMPYPLDQLPFNHAFAQLGTAFYTETPPQPLLNPSLVAFHPATAQRLGLNWNPDLALAYFSGQRPIPGARPLAMVYDGHQFGQYAGQLGDGRGLLLGDFTHNNQHYDIHLKGAGITPYSRFGDGRAVLRSCIREYLASIAMQGLGIATTHALCVLRGQERVQRETLEPRASLVRIAKTHVRFGSFEYFYYREKTAELKALAHYLLNQHLPHAPHSTEGYHQLLQQAITQTAELIAHWQAVGFAHGVLNTDNMSLLGETFDYGPYGFMESYQPAFICNHSDTSGRYAFNQQPKIGYWNLQILARCFSPLLPTAALQQALATYAPHLEATYIRLMSQKMGLPPLEPNAAQLINQWLSLLQHSRADYSLSFTRLSHQQHWPQLLQQFATQGLGQPAEAFFSALEHAQTPLDCARMPLHNPLYILRNHLAQQAIQSAEAEDYTPLQRLAQHLQAPFSLQANADDLTQPLPEGASPIVVSCSS